MLIYVGPPCIKSLAVDCQAFKDRPVDRDRLVGHPCYRSITLSQVDLECAKYLQLSDSGWQKSDILTHNAASAFRVFLKTLSPVT